MKCNTQPVPNQVTGQVSKILTVEEVANLLQIPRSSVYEKTRARRGAVPPLPCRRVGKYLRFFEAEVLEWLVALPQTKLVRRKRKAHKCASTHQEENHNVVNFRPIPAPVSSEVAR